MQKRSERIAEAHRQLAEWLGRDPEPSEECPVCQQLERVRVYDEHGEPHDEVLRTKTGRVLTEQYIQKLAEEPGQPALEDGDAENERPQREWRYATCPVCGECVDQSGRRL